MKTKTCQNCKKDFVIEPEDFDFYQKIKVPPPTWCPECRLQRRLTWRNERSLYRRKCDLCGEIVISVYSQNTPIKMYCRDCWWSDRWDPFEYGSEYRFDRPFYEQFKELLQRAPLASLNSRNAVNSEYANYAANLKDCYLVFSSIDVENGMYLARGLYAEDVMDIYQTRHSEKCYGTIECNKCYNLLFSQYCEECFDSVFLYDCRNCSRCFGCVNLRNKQYCIFNRQYSKEDYKNKIKEFNIGGHQMFLEAREQFQKFLSKFPRKYAIITKSTNVTGNDIAKAHNCLHCFNAQDDIEDCKYLLLVADKVRDVYDATYGGFSSELCIETLGCVGNNNRFSGHSWYTYNVAYSHNCIDGHDLFGCIGLRNKQYCILNKQYTKEEYEKLVPKIIEHMNKMPYVDKKGKIYKYGEFFPPELSPFCYNETIAQEYFPLTKEQAIKQGYRWKDPEERNVKPDLKTEDLPDHIKDVKDDIIGKIIQCAHSKVKKDGTLEATCNEQCTTAFKIIEPELQFYKRMNLPLPRLCPNCRHYQRLKQRNPLKLWHRKCQCAGNQSENGVYKNTIKHFHGDGPCPNEFETSYSPERPEIVYCEKCYLSEVV